jgi:hypothetical protein
MNFKFLPLIVPNIDLRIFAPIVEQKAINAVDGMQLDAIQKFNKLVESCFNDRYNSGYDHLQLSFWFELPMVLEGHLREFLGFAIACEYTGMCTQGIMTGSFRLWKQFLEWASSEDREESVRKFANWIFDAHFRKYNYFAAMSRTNLTDKTFRLEIKA